MIFSMILMIHKISFIKFLSASSHWQDRNLRRTIMISHSDLHAQMKAYFFFNC